MRLLRSRPPHARQAPLRASPSALRRPLVCAALLAAAVLAPGPEGKARVYKWVDPEGVTHYTIERDEAPERLRPRLREPVAPPLPGGPSSPLPRPDPGPETAPLPDLPVDEPGSAGLGLEVPRAPVVREASPAARTATPPPPRPAVGEPHREPAPPEVGTIEQLEDQIARDRETLKLLISEPRDQVQLAEDPRIEEIAERLPRLQAELEALRAEP